MGLKKIKNSAWKYKFVISPFFLELLTKKNGMVGLGGVVYFHYVYKNYKFFY